MRSFFRRLNVRPAAASRNTVGRAVTRTLESLENRSMMAVSIGANGYTQITPSWDTRTIYVSSSQGNDWNDGLSPSSPVKTIAKGTSLLRNGMPDHMLLKKGDAWSGETMWWSLSGRNDQEPMVVGSYGSGARPMVKTGDKMGFYTGSPIHDVAITGIHFTASTRNPDSPDYNWNINGTYGIQIAGTGTNVLIEDNQVDFYQDNVVLTGFNGKLSNIKFRKNVVANSWSTSAISSGGKSQGLYIADVNGVTVEGNVFDHNGWNEKAPGAVQTVFGHNVYMWTSNTGVVFRDNISANASSHGLQARSGGTIENNLFINNAVHMAFGKGSPVVPYGVTGKIAGNVFVGGHDIAGSQRGWAIEVGNVKSATISNNIITKDQQNANPAIRLAAIGGVENQWEATGVNNLVIEDNIVNKWHSALEVSGWLVAGSSGGTAYNNVTVRNNEFVASGAGPRVVQHDNAYASWAERWSGNTYSNSQSSNGWFNLNGSGVSFDTWKNAVESTAIAGQPVYTDPNRNVESYNSSIGGAWSVSEFMSKARNMAKDRYDARYTSAPAVNHIRAGFDRTGMVTPSGNNPAPTPTPTPTPSGSAPSAALVSTPQINTPSTWAETVKVKYSDDSAIDYNSLSGNDVVITGPNGYRVNGWFYQADSWGNGTPRTASYSIHAPGGSWDVSDNGTYTVTVLDRGVTDTSGNSVPAGVIGTFQVNVGGSLPAPTTPSTGGNPSATLLSNPSITSWSAWAETAKVQFQDDGAIRFSTLGADDIRITGPNGYAINGWFYASDASGDGQTRTASYSFHAPGGTWDHSDNGTYTITMLNGSVTDTSGNAVVGTTLGTFTVAIP